MSYHRVTEAAQCSNSSVCLRDHYDNHQYQEQQCKLWKQGKSSPARRIAQFHWSSQSPQFLSLLHLSRHILLVFEIIVIVLIDFFFTHFGTLIYVLQLCNTLNFVKSLHIYYSFLLTFLWRKLISYLNGYLLTPFYGSE